MAARFDRGWIPIPSGHDRRDAHPTPGGQHRRISGRGLQWIYPSGRVATSLYREGSLMFRVTRQIDFCYGHRLLNYDGKCRYLHGHNGRAVITIESASLDQRGMVMDFSDIKKDISQWIDDQLDHRMILNRQDAVVPVLQEMGEPLFLIDSNPTAENIAKVIYDYAVSREYPVVEVRLWETPNCYATYATDCP